MTNLKLTRLMALSSFLMLSAACSDAGMDDDSVEQAADSQPGDAEPDLQVRDNALSEDQGFMPHHTEQDAWIGGCLVRVAHGNYIFTAYARVLTFTRRCTVRAVVHALVNGRWLSRPGPWTSEMGVWVQAEYPYGSIILSEFQALGYTPITFAALRF
jgi:hypothetical protein